jgi:hypothetical protein
VSHIIDNVTGYNNTKLLVKGIGALQAAHYYGNETMGKVKFIFADITNMGNNFLHLSLKWFRIT